MNYKLGKEYKLCSKIIIDDTFDSGLTIKSYPFIAKLKLIDDKKNVPFIFVISAPKKTFKNAPDRNRIKRICKESIRLNKSILESYLNSENKQLALFLIYSTHEELNQKQLHKSVVKLFNCIIKTLNDK